MKFRRQHPSEEARHYENAHEWRLDGIGYFSFPNVSTEEWAGLSGKRLLQE